MNSHDPDFPQEIPAIPEAETTRTSAPVGSRELGVGSWELAEAPLNAITPEVMPPDTMPSDTMPPDTMPPDTITVESADPDSAEWADLPGGKEAEPATMATTETAEPATDTLTPAAEVWTELDEAEPRVVVESQPEVKDPGPWLSASSAMVGEEGEPDPSGLDAGSRPRREAEKTGRTVLPYDDWEPSEVPYQPKELGVIDQLMIVLADGATVWRKSLRQVRSWLPLTWQRNLSDELMTAIALGLLILWLVLWNPLGGRGVASRVMVDPEVPKPALTPSGDSAGNSASLAADRGPSAPAIAAENAPEVLEPSPEQSLIADIQDRVSKISRSYAAGLIQSVEVNLSQQVIAINVSNDWYGLDPASQDRIAQDIYTQAQGLAFATLQLRDADGVVVARNPIVGPSMVILKRHRLAEGDPLV